MIAEIDKLYDTYLRKRAELEEKGYSLTKVKSKSYYSEIYRLAKKKGAPNIARDTAASERVISYSLGRQIRAKSKAYSGQSKEQIKDIYLNKGYTEEEAEIFAVRAKRARKEFEGKSIKELTRMKFDAGEEYIEYDLKNKHTGKRYKGSYRRTEKNIMASYLRDLGYDPDEFLGYGSK